MTCTRVNNAAPGAETVAVTRSVVPRSVMKFETPVLCHGPPAAIYFSNAPISSTSRAGLPPTFTWELKLTLSPVNFRVMV